MSSDLSGPQRAAILLLHVDEEIATEIFRGLNRREMRVISQASKEVKAFSPEQVNAALKEYLEDMGAGTSLRFGSDILGKLAARSLGDKAKDLLNDDVSGLVDTLTEVDSTTLANVLKKEHPQTVAVVAAHLQPERAAAVLGQLPETAQSDLLRRLATLDRVNPQVLALLETALSEEFSVMGKGGSRKVGGINLVADIMNQMDKSREQALMQELEEADEDLAEEVRGLMFTFDDLARLDGRGMQTLLQEIERDTLVLALKAAGDELKDHVFGNLSSRAVDMIKEDMEQRGPVRLSDVEKAQGEVVRAALTLQQSGAIEIQSGDDDAFV